jgi:hypothetical protein
VHVLGVPSQLPLDGPLEEEEALGREVLEAASLAGKRLGLKVRTNLLRTRNPGKTIVDEALRLGSDVIYLAMDHAPPGEPALGPTASYLLVQRPCRIIIETRGAGSARARDARVLSGGG